MINKEYRAEVGNGAKLGYSGAITFRSNRASDVIHLHFSGLPTRPRGPLLSSHNDEQLQ